MTATVSSSAPVAFVTGASRGIGKQLCIDLAGAGFDVVCVARSSGDSPGKLPGTVDETARLVEATGRRAMPVGLDVRNDEAVVALADRVYAEWGRCDLLVNNAATAPPQPALDDTVKRWRSVVDVNLNGPFSLMHAICPRMREAGGGRVVNIGAGAAVMPSFGRAGYTTTKRALEALTEALAHDLSGSVAVNCVRLELAVWSEGFTATLGAGDYSGFEDPVIMSDAVLWLARQPLDYTGHILTIAELRQMGVVRPRTQAGQRS